MHGPLLAMVKDPESGATLGLLVLSPHTFRTGSRGYYATGKVTIGGAKHQAQVQLVEIGSRPDPDESEAALVEALASAGQKGAR